MLLFNLGSKPPHFPPNTLCFLLQPVPIIGSSYIAPFMKDTNVAIPEKFRMDTAQRKIIYFLPSEHLRSLLMGCYINQVVLWRQFFYHICN